MDLEGIYADVSRKHSLQVQKTILDALKKALQVQKTILDALKKAQPYSYFQLFSFVPVTRKIG